MSDASEDQALAQVEDSISTAFLLLLTVLVALYLLQLGKTMASINNISRVSHDYETSFGYTDDGRCFNLITNMDVREREKLTQVIESFEGEGEFGISEKAFGYNEDTGETVLLLNTVGLHATDYGYDLDSFWKHYAKYQ
jgi:hypothetical protein